MTLSSLDLTWKPFFQVVGRNGGDDIRYNLSKALTVPLSGRLYPCWSAARGAFFGRP